jgi:hypothetical protein
MLPPFVGEGRTLHVTSRHDRSAILEEMRKTTLEAHTEHVAERKLSREKRTEHAPAVALARARSRKVLWASLLAVPCLVLTVLNLTGHGPFHIGTPPPSPVETDRMLRSSLYMGVMDIEGYREDRGALPADLIEVGVPDRSDWTWTYNPLDVKRFVLTLSGEGRVLAYDSDRTPEGYFSDLATVTKGKRTE